MRLLNQHTSADPQWCRPTWPDLPAGASLTVDPSRPPPTTAQTPFCDWPSGTQVPSYPQQCIAAMVAQPRMSNAGRPAITRQSNPGCDAKCAWSCLQESKDWYNKNYGHGVPKAWIYGRAVACINKIAGLPPPQGSMPPSPQFTARRARARRANPLRFQRAAADIFQLMGGNRR